MSIETQSIDPDQAAIAAALRDGAPFVVLRDGDDKQLIVALGATETTTIGRRGEADIALPWDREVSRLHCELRRLAGEWTVNDDGLSQNGTFVNEVRLVGRRRLADGDLIRVGRTHITFRDPTAERAGMTMLPGELNAATHFSDQQLEILVALCRPVVAGEPPASNEAIAVEAGVPVGDVETEMAAIYGAFGVDDLPDAEARADVAGAALGSGLVSFD